MVRPDHTFFIVQCPIWAHYNCTKFPMVAINFYVGIAHQARLRATIDGLWKSAPARKRIL